MQIALIILNILVILLLVYLIINIKNKNNSSVTIDQISDYLQTGNQNLLASISNMFVNNAQIQNKQESTITELISRKMQEMMMSQYHADERKSNTQLQQFKDLMTTNDENNKKISQTLSDNLTSLQKTIEDKLITIEKEQHESETKTREIQLTQFEKLVKENKENNQAIIIELRENLKGIQKSNEDKLAQIQGVVSEKLDKTLNERLDSNFKQIGDQLSELYKTLGELNKLSTGVTDLNKTLSNVKTRGTWGEVQLRNILEQIFTPSQYDENIITKKNSNDRVEFAVKIPSREDDSFIYLPIDSKMPTDIYNKIVDASLANDQNAINESTKELEKRIKEEAKKIRDKYIDPNTTTDFAIMFLATEGLYAEALRIPGLAEFCQNKYRIMLAGPTTISALLTSLRISFYNVALSKKSKEVLKLLADIKGQYSKIDEDIAKTQKKLQEAMNTTEALKKKTNMIQNKMRNIEYSELPSPEEQLKIE